MKRVQVIGRLGADAEVMKSKAGNEFLSFRVASDEYEKNERTTKWYRVSWAGPAKMKEFLTKGKPVCVDGREEVTVYQSKTGEHLPALDIYASSVELLSFGNNSGQTQSNSESTTQAAEATIDPLPSKAVAKAAAAAKEEPKAVTVEDDDDLPF